MHDAPLKLRRLKIDPDLLTTSLLYVLGVVCLLSLVLLIKYFLRFRRMKRIADRVDELGSNFYPLLERIRAVEEHAVDYANSLDSEALACLDELQKLSRSMESFMYEVEHRLEDGSYEAVREAELFVIGRHPMQLRKELHYDGAELDLRIDADWERHIERLLQIVGKSVSNASFAATELGVPKRRKRRATLLSLFRAGIKMEKGPYQN